MESIQEEIKQVKNRHREKTMKIRQEDPENKEHRKEILQAHY